MSDDIPARIEEISFSRGLDGETARKYEPQGEDPRKQEHGVKEEEAEHVQRGR